LPCGGTGRPAEASVITPGARPGLRARPTKASLRVSPRRLRSGLRGCIRRASGAGRSAHTAFQERGYTAGRCGGAVTRWAGCRLLSPSMAVLASGPVAAWAFAVVPDVPPLPRARQTWLTSPAAWARAVPAADRRAGRRHGALSRGRVFCPSRATAAWGTAPPRRRLRTGAPAPLSFNPRAGRALGDAGRSPQPPGHHRRAFPDRLHGCCRGDAARHHRVCCPLGHRGRTGVNHPSPSQPCRATRRN